MAKDRQGFKERWRDGESRVRARNVAELHQLEGPGAERRLERIRRAFRLSSGKSLTGGQLTLLSLATFLLVVIAGVFGPQLLQGLMSR